MSTCCRVTARDFTETTTTLLRHDMLIKLFWLSEKLCGYQVFTACTKPSHAYLVFPRNKNLHLPRVKTSYLKENTVFTS